MHPVFQFQPLVRISVISFAVLFLLGCGSGRPAPSGANRYLRQASESEKLAMEYESQKKDTEALSMYRDALEKIETGLKYATVNERPPFRTIKERVEPKIAELEMHEKLKRDREEAARKKAEDEKKVAALGKTDASKDEDAKRKAEEEAKKKEAEARAEQMKKLTEEKALKADKKAEEHEDDPHAKTDDAAEKKEEAPKPPPGPFKVYGENEKPPRLSVDKVEVRGEYLYAYIQVYNDSAKNMRIARPEVTFTSFQDVDLCPAEACFQYSVFDKTAVDPLEQARGAITGGSHEVFATSAFQFVAIAKNKEKASRTRKAKVQIAFDDGSTWSARGPEDAKPATVDGLPGL